MKAISLCLILTLVASVASGAEPLRIWKNNAGQTIEGTFLRFVKEKVQIKRKDGRTFTLDANQFSNEDQVYLEEVRKRTDETGELWSKARAVYHLTKQNWMDKPVGSKYFNYLQFERQKIDLNKDDKIDGFRLWKWPSGGHFKNRGNPLAWVVTENGNLIIRTFDGNGVLYEGELAYSCENKVFKRIKGYGGIPFLAPANKNEK